MIMIAGFSLLWLSARNLFRGFDSARDQSNAEAHCHVAGFSLLALSARNLFRVFADG